MDVERVLAADVLPKLTDRLKKRLAFDVAYCAADFHEYDVHVRGHRADAIFDLVRDMWNDLYGAP